MSRLFTLFALICTFAWPAIADDVSADETAVRQAAYNYVDGLYLADPSLIEKSVWKDLKKIGFYREKPEASYSPLLFMTFDELMSLAERWARNNPPGENAPRKVTIYEINDKTASAKVEAAWGFDYLQLVKFDDGSWKIAHIVWQSYPDLVPD